MGIAHYSVGIAHDMPLLDAHGLEREGHLGHFSVDYPWDVLSRGIEAKCQAIAR
jgi:uncharacterized protein (DUF2132 family)